MSRACGAHSGRRTAPRHRPHGLSRGSQAVEGPESRPVSNGKASPLHSLTQLSLPWGPPIAHGRQSRLDRPGRMG